MYSFVKEKKYYYMVYDILVLIVALTTYISIGRGILERRKSFRNTENNSRLRRTRKTFLIPFLILTSFVLCNVIPDIITVFHESNDEVYSVLVCVWSLHFTLDPVIYVFANEKYRKTALKLIRNYFPIYCYQKDDVLLVRTVKQKSFFRGTLHKSNIRSATQDASLVTTTKHYQNGANKRSSTRRNDHIEMLSIIKS